MLNPLVGVLIASRSGYGMADVAMHLTHSVSVDALRSGGECYMYSSATRALRNCGAMRALCNCGAMRALCNC